MSPYVRIPCAWVWRLDSSLPSLNLIGKFILRAVIWLRSDHLRHKTLAGITYKQDCFYLIWLINLFYTMIVRRFNIFFLKTELFPFLSTLYPFLEGNYLNPAFLDLSFHFLSVSSAFLLQSSVLLFSYMFRGRRVHCHPVICFSFMLQMCTACGPALHRHTRRHTHTC